MRKFLLDTHALIWFSCNEKKLGTKTKKLIKQALNEGNLYVSAISFWEIAMLISKGKIELHQSVEPFREEVLSLGITELPICGKLGILSISIDNFHSDPADRMITATASYNGFTLITCDKKILEWNGPLKTLDASK